jgi:hypothetical protein
MKLIRPPPEVLLIQNARQLNNIFKQTGGYANEKTVTCREEY